MKPGKWKWFIALVFAEVAIAAIFYFKLPTLLEALLKRLLDGIAVGVQYDAREGILVNHYLQTTNLRIYAAGDVCLKWTFTHAADFAARIVIQNALMERWLAGQRAV
jgi:hypothetical protein